MKIVQLCGRIKLHRILSYFTIFIVLYWFYILIYIQQVQNYVTEIQGWDNNTKEIRYYVNRSSTILLPNLAK